MSCGEGSCSAFGFHVAASKNTDIPYMGTGNKSRRPQPAALRSFLQSRCVIVFVRGSTAREYLAADLNTVVSLPNPKVKNVAPFLRE